jgi:hypothetical protein
MAHHLQITTFGCALCLYWASIAPAADEPTTTPTPRPGTLAALASATPLKRGPESDPSATILITNDTLAELGDDAALTVLTSTVAEAVILDIEDRVDPKIRVKWRSEVLAQSKIIARAEAKKDAVRTEIDLLERGRLDSRTLDRIAKAETKLRAADDEIKRAKAELSKIVREARKEGAQPGWFR